MVVVVLVQDISDEVRSEVFAGQHVGRHWARRQQTLAVGRHDALTQGAGGLGTHHPFLDHVLFVALGNRARRRVEEANAEFLSDRELSVLGTFLGTRAFFPLGERRPRRRLFESAEGDLRSGF